MEDEDGEDEDGDEDKAKLGADLFSGDQCMSNNHSSSISYTRS